MPRLIDTHCHLHFPAFGTDREAILSRLQEKNIHVITVGTTLKTSREAVQFADTHEGVWATVGYHPEHFTNSYHDEAESDAGEYSIDDLRAIAMSSKKVVAIGETGLDFFRVDPELNVQEAHAKQEKGLRDQIALASELDLPLVIHCRDAFTRLAEILKEERVKLPNVRGAIHCFTGNWTEAQLLLDCGFHLSFSGIVTFPLKKTQDPEISLQRVAERMPLEKLLIETDAPWLAPMPHRGQQNEPTYVEFVCQKIAELRNISVEEVAQQTTKNAQKLFFP